MSIWLTMRGSFLVLCRPQDDPGMWKRGMGTRLAPRPGCRDRR